MRHRLVDKPLEDYFCVFPLLCKGSVQKQYLVSFCFLSTTLFFFPVYFSERLCEEGKSALEQLLKFMVHPAITSINLTTALGSLATLARQRPMFMSEVIQAYETLHGKCLVLV